MDVASISAAVPKGPDRSAKVAQDFEAVFLTQVVEEMMKTVDLGSFSGGEAEEAWRHVLAESVADQIAKQGRTGIAQSVQGTIAAYSGGMRQDPSE